MKRRKALVVGSGVLALAGCVDVLDSDDSESDTPSTDPGDDRDPADGDVSTEWTSHRGDPANTGVRPAEAGPGRSLSIAWEVTHEDLLIEQRDIDAEELDFQLIPGETTWPVLVDETVLWTQGYDWIADGDDESGSETVLVAADATDGSIVWTVPLGEEPLQAWFAPIVHGGSVLLPNLVDGSLGMTVHAVDDGSELERYDWGLSTLATQPVAADGTVIIGVEEDGGVRLRAFDADDGTPLWDVPGDSRSNRLPQLAVRNDAVYSFARQEGALVARAVESGEERWTAPVELPTSLVTERPSQLGPVTASTHGLFAGGSIEQFANRDVGTITAFDGEEGITRFTHNPPGTDAGDPLESLPDVSEAELERIREEYLDGAGFSSANCQPLVVDERVIGVGWGEVGNASGTIVYAIHSDTEETIWGVEIASDSFAPVAAGDVVYVTTTAGIEAVSTDGERLDSVVLESDAETVSEHTPRTEFSPALGHGRLFVPTTQGIVAIE